LQDFREGGRPGVFVINVVAGWRCGSIWGWKM